jgi:hypothetical protein
VQRKLVAIASSWGEGDSGIPSVRNSLVQLE